ncbi:MAG TPA: hypothetical protein VJR22_04910 [Candidatus Nitrosotalea sp.]|nr:hypothetical protein [Candidatus Nitrosotalea sp.]
MSRSYERLEKTLVGLVIEQTLLHIGKPTFDKVETLLQERYQCTLADSCDNPQYLRKILEEVFGKSYTEIINSIEKRLIEFRQEPTIEEFIAKMSK